MIEKIGVIYQDPTSLGVLLGIRDRLGCTAELIPPKPSIGAPRLLPSRQIKKAVKYFLSQRVDLIVRFTDADGQGYQDTERTEVQRVPEQYREIWVEGVAVENVEDLLCRSRNNLAEVLGIQVSELECAMTAGGRVKHLIAELFGAGEKTSEAVRRFVRELPEAAFRRWLQDSSFRRFYDACRRAAALQDCEVRSEATVE